MKDVETMLTLDGVSQVATIHVMTIEVRDPWKPWTEQLTFWLGKASVISLRLASASETIDGDVCGPNFKSTYHQESTSILAMLNVENSMSALHPMLSGKYPGSWSKMLSQQVSSSVEYIIL